MMSLCVGLWQWRSGVALLILVAFTIAYLYEYKNQEGPVDNMYPIGRGLYYYKQ